MTDPLARIEEGCYLAFRFMLRVSSAPTGCLEVREGHYGFREGARAYHPLEKSRSGRLMSRSGRLTADGGEPRPPRCTGPVPGRAAVRRRGGPGRPRNAPFPTGEDAGVVG